MEIVHEDVTALRPGRYIIIDGKACEIVDIAKSAPGKHGHAKYRITAVDLMTGTKKMTIYTSHDKAKVPIIDKRTAQVLSVSGDKAQIMDMGSFETIEIKIPDEYKDKVVANATVSYWLILGEKVIKDVRPPAE